MLRCQAGTYHGLLEEQGGGGADQERGIGMMKEDLTELIQVNGGIVGRLHFRAALGRSLRTTGGESGCSGKKPAMFMLQLAHILLDKSGSHTENSPPKRWLKSK